MSGSGWQGEWRDSTQRVGPPVAMIVLQLVAAVILLLELNLIQVLLTATCDAVARAIVNVLPFAAVAAVGYGAPFSRSWARKHERLCSRTIDA